jgi:formate dehydrogenase iron-sulfur subunit
MKSPVAILTDTTRCTGCERCVDACKEENHLGRDHPWRGQGSVSALSSSRYCTVLPRPGHRYVREQCRHCLEPACVSACLVGAMQKTPEGPVIYDADRCMGCRYCLAACPYGIPRYEWYERVPHVSKCNLCAHRIREGKLPACVEACPEKATIFGSRTELLEEAHRRLAAHPGRYYPKVYGEHEVGGTSVLYISDIPLDFLAWRPNLSTEPLPELTAGALHKVPPTILLVGGLMTGIYWVIGRRMRLAAEAAQAARVAAGHEGEAGAAPADAPGGGSEP